MNSQTDIAGGEIGLEYGRKIAITETLPDLSTTLLQARIATGSSEEPLRFSEDPACQTPSAG